MNLYLMRHGQTSYNASKRIQGSISTIELTSIGIEQARSVKGIINHLNIQHCYSGSLTRQVQTAHIVLEDLKNVNFNELCNFNEICFGEFEGQPTVSSFERLNERLGTHLKGFASDNPLILGQSFHDADLSHCAESGNDVADRFYKGIQSLELKYPEDDCNILIVSSGMALGCFIYKYCQNPEVFSMKNCSIELVTKKDDIYLCSSIFEGI